MSRKSHLVPIDTLFSDESAFEQTVLEIHNESDRREVVGILAEEILKGPLQTSVNFSHLKSYDDFQIDGIPKSILHRIVDETALYLFERRNLTKEEARSIIYVKANLLFLNRMSLFYYKRFGKEIFGLIIDTFFDRVAALTAPEKATHLLVDVLAGTPKTPPLFKGGQEYFKQVWENTRKALQMRKKEMGKIQIAMASILKIMETEEGLAEDELAKLQTRYQWNKERLEVIRTKPLAEFSASLQRLKNEGVQSLYDFKATGHL